MIHQSIYLSKYDWMCSIWYAQTKYNLAGVMTDLQWIDCPTYKQREFLDMMNEGRYNCGMTYSNFDLRESVMVVGLADSEEQYTNSITHEIGHLAEQISEADGLDMHSEKPYYLMGDIAQRMYPVSHKLTCPSCGCDKKHRI